MDFSPELTTTMFYQDGRTVVGLVRESNVTSDKDEFVEKGLQIIWNGPTKELFFHHSSSD